LSEANTNVKRSFFRWTDPVDPTPWRGRYDASFPKPMCYQKNCSETDEMAGECIPMVSTCT